MSFSGYTTAQPRATQGNASQGDAVRQRYVLTGRVVTMDAGLSVFDSGAVAVDGPLIAAVGMLEDVLAGREGWRRIDTAGTLYPGLIDLHNHILYNIKPLWVVPELFPNRYVWRGRDDYKRFIGNPVKVLTGKAVYACPLVRYIECKTLMGGVTTTQGFSITSEVSLAGLVRNVEMMGVLNHINELPGAKLWAKLGSEAQTQHMHLAEGVDQSSLDLFSALEFDDGSGRRWAINERLIAPHCLALQEESSWRVFGEHKGNFVWSPLSNLLLYGGQAAVGMAKRSGVPIALGPDWTPSGSKSLLHELKIARLMDKGRDLFSDAELCAMVTSTPARMLRWPTLGKLEPGCLADILVLEGQDHDPYELLVRSGESRIALVLVEGTQRYGRRSLLERFDPASFDVLEQIDGVAADLWLNLKNAHTDACVQAYTFADARAQMQRLLEHPPKADGMQAASDFVAAVLRGQWLPLADMDADHDSVHELIGELHSLRETRTHPADSSDSEHAADGPDPREVAFADISATARMRLTERAYRVLGMDELDAASGKAETAGPATYLPGADKPSYPERRLDLPLVLQHREDYFDRLFSQLALREDGGDAPPFTRAELEALYLEAGD